MEDPRPRVLVVDDDPTNARLTARAFQRHCDTTICTSAAEALERLYAKEAFEVVLCDVMMPLMTGTQFYEKAVAFDPALAGRIVLVTGGASPSELEKIQTMGIRCLTKPVPPEDFNTLVIEGRTRLRSA